MIGLQSRTYIPARVHAFRIYEIISHACSCVYQKDIPAGMRQRGASDQGQTVRSGFSGKHIRIGNAQGQAYG